MIGPEPDSPSPDSSAPEAEPAAQIQTNRLPKWIFAGVVVLLLAYPAVRWISRSHDTPLPANSPGADAGLVQASFDLYRAGRYAEAIAAAQAALKQNPNLATAYNNMAVSYAALHQWDQALDAAQQAVRVQPDFQLAKNNITWILQEKAKGAPSAPSPPATAPTEADKFIALSLDSFQAKLYQQCVDAGRKALKLNPTSAIAYNNIGACYGAMGKFTDEILSESQALRLDPNYQLARNNLNWALEQQKSATRQGSK